MFFIDNVFTKEKLLNFRLLSDNWKLELILAKVSVSF